MKKRYNYWLLLPYIRPQWRTITKGFLGIFGYVLATLVLINLAGKLAIPFGQGNVVAIVQVTGIYALIFLVRALFQSIQEMYMAKAALKVAFNLRQQLYSHLQKLNLSYFETTKTVDLSYRLIEDVDRVGEVVNKIFHEFIPCILLLVAIPIYMIYLNWQLTLVAVIVAPLIAILISWFGKQLGKNSLKNQNRASGLSAIISEIFNGIRLVQAFAAENYEIARSGSEAERSLKAKYSAQRFKAMKIPIVGFLETSIVLSLLIAGAWQISQDNLTIANFFSYIAAGVLLIDPISYITKNYNQFEQGKASISRVFELMAIKPTVIEKPNAIALPPIEGQVEYRHVSFGYQPGERLLKDISFLVSPGEAIAIVGTSAASKTTFVNLLPRFYDPKVGRILIDGVDIRDVKLNSLRRQIGILPQQTIMFSGTIAQNIAFGQGFFDMQEVTAAAKIANAHEFISELPEGYRTWVGEGGVNLSLGQRQRIAIARIVHLNPKILILNEATSALDSESEALVREALERLIENRTVFIIAHRLSTVKKCDRILVLEQGEIIESGTHEELLARKGRYVQFYGDAKSDDGDGDKGENPIHK
ncbi:LuxR family transcriptional regulator [Nostoc sp. DSM 114161]|uniref:ABC transporter ATP-binding protein n=1 Tax=Nostoc sp. DSM 114161 TaxID=3440143 RepID=UPI00404662A0